MKAEVAVKNTLEQEQFWKDHIVQQKKSGLSRLAYCRKHQLNYDKFGYWFRKCKTKPSSHLVPIKLQRGTEHVIATNLADQVLCSLTLKNGSVLKIHDKEVIAILLSVLN